MYKEPLKPIVESQLPTRYGTFKVKTYLSQAKDFPHLALFTDGINLMDIVDVRIHSECMTGDVFGSVKCDCGEQLDYSMKWVQKHGGVILYLRQEGRGIGLNNKFKAYNLQEKGLNTREANLELGFHSDHRDYDLALAILENLGVQKIRLLTNNPDKISAFESSKIELIERLPVEMSPHPENQDYLSTKKNEMGHLLFKISN